MKDLEINLGDWVFKLSKRAVYYTFESASFKGKELNCKRIEIRMAPQETVEITVIDAKVKGSEA